MEENIIKLEDENGNIIDFEVIDVYELDGVTYFALIEAEEGADEEGVLIMRVEGEDDDAELVTIESEAELEAAFEEFVRRDSECEEGCDCENHNH